MADDLRAKTSPTPRPAIIPPMVVQPGVEKLDSPVLLPDDSEFPIPTFTTAKLDRRKRRMPQCIAHRGYKARYPENTMLAFEKALEAGAVALETDVHITKDRVVVLSHDATLKRCFGQKDKVIERTWDEIKDLRTLAAPHEHMPRLKDLLDYLSQPGLEDIWVLLDIKLDNDADDIMRLIGTTIGESDLAARKPWKQRVVLGIWAAKYLPLAAKYLPGFSVMHIGFKLSYARHFFDVPDVGFNMLLPMLMAPGGAKFIRDCQEVYHRQLLAWTVNDKDRMAWCIRRKLDGVITDDPSMFVEACETHDEYSREPAIPVGFRACVEILRVYIMISALFWLFRRRLNPTANSALIGKAPRRE
ncbi:hypothetical protein CKM354_000361500 [Cercospora kikuchii]|uniref:GP-PDE domain-containing protein n=1 Tax=Cercospora kikuchii TaxID=84275 RepID=A0A9P3CCF2_9PEZI|nr:phosphatidylglycerol phospholipase [Cercospora kikuchii]GIZ40268.1 hypothetical protein CKM354_000361500 [Cercospora kikuchii]